jgi:hypothetical protein
MPGLGRGDLDGAVWRRAGLTVTALGVEEAPVLSKVA